MPVSRDWGVGGCESVLSKRSGLTYSLATMPSWDGESSAEQEMEGGVECVVFIMFLGLVDGLSPGASPITS